VSELYTRIVIGYANNDFLPIESYIERKGRTKWVMKQFEL